MNKQIIKILFSILTLPFFGNGQIVSNQVILNWLSVQTTQLTKSESVNYLYFEDAVYNTAEFGYLPLYFNRVELKNNFNAVNVHLSNQVWETIDNSVANIITGSQLIPEEIITAASISIERKHPFAHIYVLPIRKNIHTGQIERLISFETSLTFGDIIPPPTHKNSRDVNSLLSTGDWFKLRIDQSGIFKISYDDLENFGMDPASIDPRNIRLFGYGGGMLPEVNYEPFVHDLIENAIQVVGEDDGIFDPHDYILFYGKSQRVWRYNPFQIRFEHTDNLYSDFTHYFITSDLGAGKRINNENSTTLQVTDTVTTFFDYDSHEVDLYNLIKSGKIWYGEVFDLLTPSRTFSFYFPDIDTSRQVHMKTSVAGKSTEPNHFHIFYNDEEISTASISSIAPTSIMVYARTSKISQIFSITGPAIDLRFDYDTPTSISKGWIDFLEITVIRHLIFSEHQMEFRDIDSKGRDKVGEFILSGVNEDVQVWEITNHFEVKKINGNINDNQFIFRLCTDSLREFIAFDGETFHSPQFAGVVQNQNLHNTGVVDMVIVADSIFLMQANRLADIHRTNDNMKILVTSPGPIYNEFSSGSQDIAAIRNFMRFIYEQAEPGEEPAYLLFFGDGSYDPKDRIPANTNFIPTFQSQESLMLSSSYVTDDFFGLLDFGEGGNAAGTLDIGIGRFPVKTVEEAQHVVDKIEHYIHSKPEIFGGWRNKICFIADDEDLNLHFKQAEELADSVSNKEQYMNINKIYLDAYSQVSTPGGNRYPEANKAINKQIEEGALIVNYTGHGGEEGWSGERVLEISDITGWTNYDNLPLFVTATCEFSRYDDPARTSAGELVLLSQHGGGIGLITTTRLAFATANFAMNKRFYEHAFAKNDGKHFRLGDLVRLSKTPPNNNIKNIHLLGDPALMLAYPEYRITTTEINGNLVTDNPDTLKALTEVVVSGFIADCEGNILTDFYGFLYPVVYDKTKELSTLGNDPRSYPALFDIQNSILYKGKISVFEGKFTFTFYIPKDISYQYGFGKISYYADNGVTDATGHYENILVGGIDENVHIDTSGPLIDLFINDRRFISGNITNEDPILLANLSDQNGINALGIGIGHDIVSTIDNKTEHEVVLNDYYTCDENSYQSGKIAYPYFKLTEGYHVLSLKAWDLQNNSSTSTIEFIVSDNISLAVGHLLNYPNPFFDKTFFSFEHNQFNESLKVTVFIFDISGALVKTIGPVNVYSSGYFTDPIEWDGTADNGSLLGRGIYIYKAAIQNNKESISELSGKLIILK